MQTSRFASHGAAHHALRASIFALAAALALACLASFSYARPPLPPLEVQLVPIDSLTPGHAARFRISAVPRFPADEISIEITTGPNIQWLSGAKSLRVSARRDVTVERVFTVRVPNHAREALYVRFEARGPDGTVWRRGAGLGLGPEPRGRAVSDGRGGQALEYDAAPAGSR